MKRHACIFVAMTVLVIATPQSAAPQGRGRPKNPRAAPAATPTSSTPAATQPATSASVIGFRQYGTWLDDATALDMGEGWTGVGIGYWHAPGGDQIDVPMLDVGLAVAPRLQASASVPFYRVNYAGATARGLDDVYLSAKITALDAANSPVGIAVSPLLEILSAASDADARLHWALPVSVEVRGGAYRVYGSAGYFSRGAVFTGGAIEWTSAAGTSVTGAVTQSMSTVDATGTTTAGRQRVDVSLGLARPVADIATVWANVGRTVTSIAAGGSSLALSGGLTFRFNLPQSVP